MLVTKMKEIEDGTFVAINRDKRMKYLVETKQCKWGSTYIFLFVCLCAFRPETKIRTKAISTMFPIYIAQNLMIVFCGNNLHDASAKDKFKLDKTAETSISDILARCSKEKQEEHLGGETWE